jgi:hypothetical protein
MKTILVISLSLLTAVCSWAGALDRTAVSADAVWIAHLDVDNFKQTAVGRHVLAEMEKPEAANKLAAFQAIFSFDPREDITALTLYGVGNEPKDGVLILDGQFDTGHLTTLVKGAKDYTSSNHGTHVIHEWTDEKKERQGRKDAHTVAAMHGGRIVFGQTFERVAGALDVLDGRSANLDGTAYFTESSDTGNAFLQVATRKVEVPTGKPHSALLRQAEYLSLTAEEQGGRVGMDLFAQAASDEVAERMRQVADGLIALASMQTNKPSAAALAQATTLYHSGNQLTASIDLAADDVVQWMKDQEAKKAQE